jgi:hypothetical protein
VLRYSAGCLPLSVQSTAARSILRIAARNSLSSADPLPLTAISGRFRTSGFGVRVRSRLRSGVRVARQARPLAETRIETGIAGAQDPERARAAAKLHAAFLVGKDPQDLRFNTGPDAEPDHLHSPAELIDIAARAGRIMLAASGKLARRQYVLVGGCVRDLRGNRQSRAMAGVISGRTALYSARNSWIPGASVSVM